MRAPSAGQADTAPAWARPPESRTEGCVRASPGLGRAQRDRVAARQEVWGGAGGCSTRQRTRGLGWEKVEKLRENYQPRAWHRQRPGAGESSDLEWQTQGPCLQEPRWAHIPGLGQSRAHYMRGLVCPLGTRWRGSTGEKPLNAWVGVLVMKSGVLRGDSVGLGWLGKVPEGGGSRWALKEGRREEMREGRCRVGGNGTSQGRG